MVTESHIVPLQHLPPWNFQTDPILGAHMGTTDYLLAPQAHEKPQQSARSYVRNEDVWMDIMQRHISAGMDIILERFHVTDWFPRAPGLYYTPDAMAAREDANYHLHQALGDSPFRDQARAGGEKRPANDYTAVYTPEGKLSMLQGGIGSIRLQTIKINGESHWFMTATSDGVGHTGVPIAIPSRFYGPLLGPIYDFGAVCATIQGELEFIPDPFSRLFDNTVMVPRLYVRVTGLEATHAKQVNLATSAAVSFVSDYEGEAGLYVSYVTFRPDVPGSFEKAMSWMKTQYVEGEYRGRIITDFDQTQTIFPEARLPLAKVMDREISNEALRDVINLMCASASADSYFNEINLQDLLPENNKTDRTKIFISYAHAAEEDTRWVERIRTHLGGLVHSKDFEVWDDTMIDPGQKWRKKIEEALNRTRVAILVLTADFMASDFIREAELPPLLEAADAEGATILCIYGSDVHLSGIAGRLKQYQFVNNPKKPLQALSKSDRESVYTKLAIAVEKALG